MSWMEWRRTNLTSDERADLLRTLTASQTSHLRDHDYVWIRDVGLLWNSVGGALQRTRFTHGTHFRTQRGEFYVDSEGSTRAILERPIPSSGDAAASLD
jgi:hypothetical protein